MSALTESSWATLGQVGRLDKDSLRQRSFPSLPIDKTYSQKLLTTSKSTLLLLKCKASKLAYKGVGTGMHMAPSETPVCFTQHAYLPQS
jgi:hypothetical protein